MKKLEKIPKNHPFRTPEGYFDELPMVIQSRVADDSPVQKRIGYAGYALRFALPAVALLVIAFFVFRPAPTQDAEELLASVETQDLIAYLAASDITVDEIIQDADFDVESVQAIEDEVYFNFDDTDLDEFYLDEIQLDSSDNL